ncbi:hypothetical protein ACFL08_01030 [Patescibacteria group bacterium]
MKKVGVFLLIVFCCCFWGCAQKMEKLMYIDEVGNMDEVMKTMQDMNNPRNWREFEIPVEAVFCIDKRSEYLDRCSDSRAYQVKKYLPKSISFYRYIIFRNDVGKEQIFLIDNLPNESDRVKITEILEVVDP